MDLVLHHHNLLIYLTMIVYGRHPSAVSKMMVYLLRESKQGLIIVES